MLKKLEQALASLFCPEDENKPKEKPVKENKTTSTINWALNRMGYDITFSDLKKLSLMECLRVKEAAKKTAKVKYADDNESYEKYLIWLQNMKNEMYRSSGLSCQKCGKEGQLLIMFRTCPESWAHLAGREGYMVFCEDCLTVSNWCVTVMN